MSEHTKGPWHSGLIGARHAVFDAQNGQVASVLGYGHEQADANARLIAAAPELLGVAEAILARLAVFLPVGPVLEAQLEEVVRKAKGGAS